MFRSSSLRPATLYLGDNGRCFCGACAPPNARSTGRDLSGLPVEAVTQTDAQELARLCGRPITCETCGRQRSTP